MVDDERNLIHSRIHAREDLFIYGVIVVRKELRAVKRTVEGINLRVDLLRIYDDLVKKTYPLEEEIEKLAEEYFNSYLSLGGTLSKDKIMNDFLIIACASLKNLSIVVSEDVRTMFGELALKAYTLINEQRNLSLPEFVSYFEFKNEIKK